MEESGSAARLILVVLGDHGQTSDAKARWRSNHRLLVRWYQIVPSIQDHPKSAWKSLVETSSWNHQPTGSTKSATADRITWQEDIAGHDKTRGLITENTRNMEVRGPLRWLCCFRCPCTWLANLGYPAKNKSILPGLPEGSRGYD